MQRRNDNKGHNMGAYIPMLVWVVSAVICDLIAKKRKVKATLLRTLLVVIFGPFAIPLVFFFKPEPNTGL